MRLLLDTHALIWAATSPQRIKPAVLAVMRDEPVFVSVVSAYEMIFKMNLGKLSVAQRLLSDLAGYLEQQSFTALPVR